MQREIYQDNDAMLQELNEKIPIREDILKHNEHTLLKLNGELNIKQEALKILEIEIANQRDENADLILKLHDEVDELIKNNSDVNSN